MTIEDIMPIVLAQVHKAPVPLVFAEVRAAAREYLTATRAWEEGVRFTLAPYRHEYELVFAPDREAIAVYGVVNMSDGYELAHVGGDTPPLMGAGSGGDFPSCWRFVNGRMQVFPVGNVEEGQVELMATCALTTRGIHPWLPDFVDADAVAYGAIARLLASAGQEWSNIQLGQYFEERFKHEIARRRSSRIHGGRPGGMSLAAPVFE